REMVKNMKGIVLFQLGDQGEDRVGSDIDEGTTPGVHRAARLSRSLFRGTEASVSSMLLTHASMSARALRASISFLAFLRSGSDSGRSNPKFTIIGWKPFRHRPVMYRSSAPKAVVGGGTTRGSSAINRAALRPAKRPVAADSI